MSSSPASFTPSGSLRTLALAIQPITAHDFAPYGTLIEATYDGKPFGPDEAQLTLDRGTPRFYIMRLEPRPMQFARITRHAQVTQCLAAVGGESWIIAVCPPVGPDCVGALPDLAHLKAFRVPGTAAIKLHRSTWHAGPFFEGGPRDFFNLELADTNLVDHLAVDLAERFGVMVECGA